MKLTRRIKAYLRRLLICRERKKARTLVPLHISSKTLKAEKQHFEGVVEGIVSKVRSHTPEEFREEKKELLTDFRILSYNGDQMGKVLEHDGRIFRGIYAESVPAFVKLWNTGLLQTLSDEGYIPRTIVSSFYTPEYPIILEHQVLPMSTGKMWNPDMIKDACICTCIINEVSKKLGYKLIDGHLNNITFYKGRPVFTDIGSIVEDHGQYTSFESSIIFAGAYKLVFSSLGNSILDRMLPYDEDNNSYWVAPMHYDESTYEYRYFLRKFRGYHRWHSSIKTRQIISRMFSMHEVRLEYFSLLFGSDSASMPTSSADYSKDAKAVVKALHTLPQDDWSSVTDIGGTKGELSKALQSAFEKDVISLESDRPTSRAIYRLCKKNSLQINCFEINYLYGTDSRTRSQIRSDVAVSVDITGTPLAYQNWKAESLMNSLMKLAKRYVVITFHKGHMGKKCTDEATCSDFEAFEKCFCSFFDLVDVKPVDGNRDARLYIGKIRGNDNA